jgi:hypothetical protein
MPSIRHVVIPAFLVLFLMNGRAIADTAECIIKPGPPIATKDQKTGFAIGHLKSDDFVYARWPQDTSFQLFSIHQNAFREISGVDPSRVECHASGSDKQYPVVFTGVEGRKTVLDNFGIYYGEFGKRPKLPFSCPDIGAGYAGAGITATTMKRYRARGFNIRTLCMALTSGQVRFDPETGRRLPTYVVIDRNVDGVASISPEVPFEAPACFSRGVANFRGLAATMSPLGCSVKYHPWSGRKLSENEAMFFTKNAVLKAAGDAGDAIEDSKKLAADPNRRPTTQLLQMIKDSGGLRLKSQSAR